MKVKSNARNNSSEMSINNNLSIQGVEIFGKEGFWDIKGKDGKIISISKSYRKDGGIVTPRFADIHVHLDKTGTAKRIFNRANSLFEAISLMATDKILWTKEDIYFRANEAIKSAWKNGTGSMRTHVDWEKKEKPVAWEVLKQLSKEWKDQIKIELVPLCSLDLEIDDLEHIAKEVKNDSPIFGCFIYRNERMESKLKNVFEIALRYNLSLDFHVDEGLDEDAFGIDCIIKLTEVYGLKRKVLCGHGCSLSVRDQGLVSKILERAAKAEVGLTCLPTTNLWLQDNVEGNTPRFRGIAPIKEARKIGVSTMVGTDNCQDSFYPFGSYNLLSTYKIAVIGAHLDEKSWFDSITTIPASWMKVNSKIIEGGDATFLRFYINSFCDLISRVNYKYEVWQRGKLVNSFN